MSRDKELEANNQTLRDEITVLKKQIVVLTTPIVSNRFLYDFEVTDNDEITLLLELPHVTHSVLLDRRSVKSFNRLFELNDIKRTIKNHENTQPRGGCL